MVSWQDSPSTLTQLNAANLDAAFAEKADAVATTAALATKADGSATTAALATKTFEGVAHTVVLGAPSGGDDAATITAAIAAAVTACQADGTNICKVILPAGIYVASRALVQDTPATGIYRNSQIPLPWIPKTAQKVTIVIEGAAPAGTFPMYGQSVKQSEGTVLSSTLTGQVFDATRFYPSIMGGVSAAPVFVFSNVNVVVRDLTFRAPDNPSLVGLDLGCCGTTDVRDCRWDTDVIAGSAYYSGTDQTAIAVPTHPTGLSYIAPRGANNPIQRLRNATFSGWYCGPWFNEHFDADNLTIVKCRVALGVQAAFGGHTARIGYVSAEHCLYSVAGVDETGVVPISGAGAMVIDYLDIEDKSSPADAWATVVHIYDPANTMRGRILTHRGVEGVGSTDTGLTQIGGRNLTLDNDGRQRVGEGPAGILPSFWLRGDRTNAASGATLATWYDTAKGVPATTIAGTPIMTRDGIGGRPAVTFPATTSYLDTARSASSRPLTIVMVCNFTDFADYRSFSGITGTVGGGITFRPDKTGQPNAGKMQLLDAGTTLIASAGTVLVPGTNYVLAVTFDASGNYAFYLNGVPDGSGTNAAAITAGKYRRIGADANATPVPVRGVLAEYAEWDVVLTPGEILAVSLDLASKYALTGDTITPGYTNSYRDPTTVAGQPLRFWRLGGIAYAEGVFENGASVTPAVNVQYPAGQLPTGWRPQYTVTRPGIVNIAAVGFGVTNFRVESTGVVSWQGYASGGPYAAGAISVAVARISWPIFS